MPEEARESRPRVTPQPIEDELHRSYIDYAMSVIVGRALPDVRDGLKPVQRRILHAMNELGMSSGSAHKKAARVVGECLGKWHPHGDLAVYDALARMVQSFSLRYPLLDGQGNWGSTEDEPAAMRYTECRLAKTAEAMLEDLEKETVELGEHGGRAGRHAVHGMPPRKDRGGDARRPGEGDGRLDGQLRRDA